MTDQTYEQEMRFYEKDFSRWRQKFYPKQNCYHVWWNIDNVPDKSDLLEAIEFAMLLLARSDPKEARLILRIAHKKAMEGETG